MPFTILDAAGPIFSAKVSGELGKAEVGQMQSAALKLIERCGKISALFILDKDISKIAVVGDEQWRDLVYAFLAKGFRQTSVEYFLPADLAKARGWLEADNPK